MIDPAPTRRRLLATDGYKFSMAEAGFPLRQETFYYTHRRGGWGYVPLDIAAHVRALLDGIRPTEDDYAYLAKFGYAMGGAFREAMRLQAQVRVDALPKGAWFYEREPVFSVTGPSALVSWLEPLILQLHYRIQVATAALLRPETLPTQVTCSVERDIVAETLDAVGVASPACTIATEAYEDAIAQRARRLVQIVDDFADRLFEVGLRAASCPLQHTMALSAIRNGNIARTSHVWGAQDLCMVPVGTMGHEHVQRHGSDREAFTAMRDRFPGAVSYLLDTFSTLESGIPEAIRAMSEAPTRPAALRFDAERGVETHYLAAIEAARAAGVTPTLVLESGWNAEKTRRFEELRVEAGWPAARQTYGFGGYFVEPPWRTFRRDDVAAVWKLCQTGDRATMKFGDEGDAVGNATGTLPWAGKASVPGRPVVWRIPTRAVPSLGYAGVVAQEEEESVAFSGAIRLTGLAEVPPALRGPPPPTSASRYSAATVQLLRACTERRAKDLEAIHARA